MNRSHVIVPAALLVAALFAIAAIFWAPALAQEKGKDKAVQPAAKWEYKIIQAERTKFGRIDGDQTQETLNKVGTEGWECVGPVADVYNTGARTATDIHLLFKRPKQ